jgi:F420H(2)-dependent quinone reductase
MLLLDHIGAKSGTKRTSPLKMLDRKNVVVIASKGGHPNNPAWFHNLMGKPDTTVQIGSARKAVHARVAKPSERKRLWPKVIHVYGGYADYQRHTEREIPLVLLEPLQPPFSSATQDEHAKETIRRLRARMVNAERPSRQAAAPSRAIWRRLI